MSALASRVDQSRAAADRQTYTYQVPASVDASVQSITISELTAEEELMATKRVGGDILKLASELPKQALFAVNGNRVTLADGSADKAWAAMRPQLRRLVMTAFDRVHNPKDVDVDDFLKSQEVSVG